jgi:succinyl-diaminopimelate desuccinylase
MNVEEMIIELEKCKEQIAGDIIEMSKIPAINPRMNGLGEYKRFQWIIQFLEKRGIQYKLIQVPDSAVEEKVRLNVVVTIDGTEDTEKTLWFIAHVDTVNTGDLDLWNTDPFNPQREGDRIYGLGVEDNSQSVISQLYTCAALFENKARAKCNIGFIFGSDEETGSQYGLHALLEENIFSNRDEAVVPDGGSPDGSFIEIAEKSMVWLKFTVKGKQGHAAMPHLGVNACSAGMHLGVELEDMLKKEFTSLDELFDPPYSTFELTQKLANVESPNVMPGNDVFYIDMRILPEFTVDQVVKRIDEVVKLFTDNHEGIQVHYEFTNRVDAPKPTSSEAEVVQKLLKSLKESGIENAYYGGIGGGTCGAILRARDIPAVVWSHLDELAHQPNEYVKISNIIKDIKIFLSTIQKY